MSKDHILHADIVTRLLQPLGFTTQVIGDKFVVKDATDQEVARTLIYKIEEHDFIVRHAVQHLINGEVSLDQQDRRLVAKYTTEREKISGARIGDFVIFPDGRVTRFTYRWPDQIQTGSGGRFHLLEDGNVSYSGGMDPGIPTLQLRVLQGHSRLGRFWIWHHGYAAASNAIDCLVPCRVYSYEPK